MQTHWQSDKDRLLQPAPDRGLPVARPTSHLPTLHRACFGFFLILLPATFWFRHLQPHALWPVALLLGAAFISTVVGQRRTLPVQNVVMAVGFILALAGLVLSTGASTNLPFGPFVYTDDAGDCLFSTLPWMMPLLWVVVVLNCRGVARLLLRPWRKVRTYGFRVIGLTCVLAMLFDLGLEPFATRAYHFWLWQPTNLTSTWYGAPWINSFAWLTTTLLILAFATPWLINKRPVQHPPDYHPLGIWLGLNLVIGITLLLFALWLAAIVVIILTAIITPLALSYARW